MCKYADPGEGGPSVSGDEAGAGCGNGTKPFMQKFKIKNDIKICNILVPLESRKWKLTPFLHGISLRT